MGLFTYPRWGCLMMRNQSGHQSPLLVERDFAPQHQEYLAARAVPLELAKKAGLVSVSKSEAEQLLGFGYPGKSGGLWIPYPGADDFGRLRLDEPFQGKNGKPTRYLTPKEEVRPYLPSMIPAEDWSVPKQTIYIVESPIKALALVAVGLLAVGLAGVRTGHKKGAPVHCLHPILFALRHWFQCIVVILFDAGRAISEEVRAAEKRQAELYASAGAEVLVAELPLTQEGKDQGPDDFLKKHGAEALRQVLQRAKPFSEVHPPGPKKEPQKTQAQLLVELSLEAGVTVWSTPSGEAWCSLQVNGHQEDHALKSTHIKRYLRHLAHTQEGFIPGGQALQDAIATLDAALLHGSVHPVFVRMGEYEGRFYIDLGTPERSAVEIDAEGWRIIAKPPVRFRRPKGLLPLPAPQRGKDIQELRRYLNTPEETEWRFLVAWLLAALRPKGPYPIAVLQGEQGCAKSTTARMMRALIDPNATPLRSTPRNEQDLAIAAMNGWAPAYDNLSGLPEWLSDALCRASTGGGYATRALHTDDEETLLDYQRPIIINGIDEVATRGDLADRALLVTLPRIPEEKRREEREVWAEFEAARPFLLGALLDVVAAGLRQLPTVFLSAKPRMADFAVWISACEPALSWGPGSFLALYTREKGRMAEASLESDPFAVAIQKKLTGEASHQWEGTLTALLLELGAEAGEEARKSKGWPKDATRASDRLRRLAPALRSVGVEFEKSPSHKEGRIYHFSLSSSESSKKKEERASPASPASPTALPEAQRGDAINPPSVPSLTSVPPELPQGTLETPKGDTQEERASPPRPLLPKAGDAVTLGDAVKRIFPRQVLEAPEEELIGGAI